MLFSTLNHLNFTAHGKHYPPALEDEIWRLESIGKDGPYQKKLNKEGIRTVQEFLFSYAKDSEKLQKVSFCAEKKKDKTSHFAFCCLMN